MLAWPLWFLPKRERRLTDGAISAQNVVLFVVPASSCQCLSRARLGKSSFVVRKQKVQSTWRCAPHPWVSRQAPRSPSRSPEVGTILCPRDDDDTAVKQSLCGAPGLPLVWLPPPPPMHSDAPVELNLKSEFRPALHCHITTSGPTEFLTATHIVCE